VKLSVSLLGKRRKTLYFSLLNKMTSIWSTVGWNFLGEAVLHFFPNFNNEQRKQKNNYQFFINDYFIIKVACEKSTG